MNLKSVTQKTKTEIIKEILTKIQTDILKKETSSKKNNLIDNETDLEKNKSIELNHKDVKYNYYFFNKNGIKNDVNIIKEINKNIEELKNKKDVVDVEYESYRNGHGKFKYKTAKDKTKIVYFNGKKLIKSEETKKIITQINNVFNINYSVKDIEYDVDGAYINVEYCGVKIKQYLFDEDGNYNATEEDLISLIDSINIFLKGNNKTGTFKLRYKDKKNKYKEEEITVQSVKKIDNKDKISSAILLEKVQKSKIQDLKNRKENKEYTKYTYKETLTKYANLIKSGALNLNGKVNETAPDFRDLKLILTTIKKQFVVGNEEEVLEELIKSEDEKKDEKEKDEVKISSKKEKKQKQIQLKLESTEFKNPAKAFNGLIQINNINKNNRFVLAIKHMLENNIIQIEDIVTAFEETEEAYGQEYPNGNKLEKVMDLININKEVSFLKYIAKIRMSETKENVEKDEVLDENAQISDEQIKKDLWNLLPTKRAMALKILISNGIIDYDRLILLGQEWNEKENKGQKKFQNDSFNKFIKYVLEKTIVEPQFNKILEIIPEENLTPQVKERVVEIFVNQFLEDPIIIKEGNVYADKSLLKEDEFGDLEYTFANQSEPIMNYTNIKELIMYLMLAQNQGNAGTLSENGGNYIFESKVYTPAYYFIRNMLKYAKEHEKEQNLKKQIQSKFAS